MIGYERSHQYYHNDKDEKKNIYKEVIVILFNMNLNDPLKNILGAATAEFPISTFKHYKPNKKKKK